MKSTPYLHFDGQCAEAFAFYKDCFGGELELDKIGDSPMAEQMPAEMHDRVMHCALTNGEFVLMGSDMTTDDHSVTPGNMHSVAVTSENVEELTALYSKLAEGGNAEHPIRTEFFGTYGDLIDKFNVRWILQSDATA